MRIYVFSEHYPSPYKSYFDTQFEQFLRDGHDLRVFANERQGTALEEKVTRLGLDRLTTYVPATLRTLPAFAGRIGKNLLRNPGARLASVRRIWRPELSPKRNLLDASRALLMPLVAPDLSLVHSLSTATRFTFLRRLYPGVPVAFYYHGGEVAGVPVIPDRPAREAFTAADVVFTNTLNSKSHAEGRGCPPGKIIVSPVGFQLEEFSVPPARGYRAGGVLNLLSIGRMSAEKGFIDALHAIDLLVQRGVTALRYRLIGSGPVERELRAFVKARGLDPYIEFLGHLPRTELYARLGAADALILPSVVWGTWQENQACVVQEAMLMQVPVVATKTGGVLESIAPELLRFAVEPGDPEALARSIASLQSMEPVQLEALGRRCRQWTAGKYDIRDLNLQIVQETLRRAPAAAQC